VSGTATTGSGENQPEEARGVREHDRYHGLRTPQLRKCPVTTADPEAADHLTSVPLALTPPKVVHIHVTWA
jgi:hypothetical protein